jgi:hypothetical protein
MTSTKREWVEADHRDATAMARRPLVGLRCGPCGEEPWSPPSYGRAGQGLDGYGVYTLTDCTAVTSLEEHHSAMAFDYPMFSKPISAEELVQVLA